MKLTELILFSLVDYLEYLIILSGLFGVSLLKRIDLKTRIGCRHFCFHYRISVPFAGPGEGLCNQQHIDPSINKNYF